MFETNGVADKYKFPGPSIVARLYYHFAKRDGWVLIRLVARPRS